MKKLFLSALAAVSLLSANAQDSTVVVVEEVVEKTTPLIISGNIDTYYRSVIGADQLNADGTPQAPGSSFANGNGFSMGMAEVILEKAGEKTGFVADLVVGPRGQQAVFNSTGSPAMINQLYAYWNVSDKLTFTLGKFATYVGYELISPTGNFNYTTSYMFSYGPFLHSGLKADIALTDELSLTLAVMNPTDQTDLNPGTTYVVGGQLGYTNDNGGIWLNTRYGDESGAFNAANTNTWSGKTFQLDLTTGWDLTDDLYVGFNTTVVTTGAGSTADSTGKEISSSAKASGFMGAAVYLQYALSDNFKLGVRAEHFMVNNGGVAGVTGLDKNGDGAITDLTLSANYTVGALTFIPEIRVDLASKGYDPLSDKLVATQFMSNGKAQNSLTSFLLAAIYTF